MSKLLVLTVGLPRSGKSTWAAHQGFPVVCPDTIRLALHGQRFAPEAEPFVWAIAKIMVESLFASGSNVVILDATNTLRKRRDEWRSGKWETAFRVFDTSDIVCKWRAGMTGREDLVPVIDRMAEGFEKLGDDERLWV